MERKEQTLSLKSNQDPKNIGARFRSARSLVPNLNRKSFCERHQINRYTMQSWENGLHVSKGKNVEKFIEALAREGVYCTSEWLIDGKGEPAKPLNGANHQALADQGDSTFLDSPIDTHFETVIKSLLLAHDSINEPLISVVLPDEAMAPKFLTGDMVFGRIITPDNGNAHQKYCIVELSPERRIIRRVISAKEGFILIALDERIPSFTLGIDAKLYEIIWHLVKQ